MHSTSKVTDYLKAKLALSITSLVIGVPALAFALFGWSQTAQTTFGEYARYVCVLGSLGAMIVGSLLLNETITTRKTAAQSVKEPAWNFSL